MAILSNTLRAGAARGIDAISKLGPEQLFQKVLGKKDLGVSEAIAGRNNPYYGGGSVYASTAPQYSPAPLYTPAPTQNQPTQQGSVLGAYTGGSSGGQRTSGSNFSLPAPNLISPDQGINNGLSETDLINSEYDNFQNYLGSQEGLARQRFTDTSNAITSERDAAIKEAEGQRGIRAQELDQKAAGGRANERLNLQKVRQLLQDLEQKNAARIAVTGAGGSTTEALADRFARTAQQNVGGVLQEGQRYQNDVETERVRTNQFYDDATNKIKIAAQSRIDDARYKLNENLSNIDAERRASAQEKARARYDAWRNYYGQVNQARVEAANFQSQYDLWLQGKNQELAAASSFESNPISAQDFGSFTDPNAFSAGSAGIGATQPISYAPTTFMSRSKRQEEDQNTPALA